MDFVLCAPNPDKPGYLKYDMSPWRPDPENPGRTKYNFDKDFLSDHEKAIIEEAQTRRKIMEDILKARGIKIVDRFVPKSENKKTYNELLEEAKLI